jgi:type II secretory ATPase GspE/PulE/Tfp pilus assembly ATPase PilB-like protein
MRAWAGDNGDEGSIMQLVNLMGDTAYHMRASDIHIEPMADRVRIRYRIDGVCLEKGNIPKNMQVPLVSRFRILSGMDIAEKRLPPDGRIKRISARAKQAAFAVAWLIIHFSKNGGPVASPPQWDCRDKRKTVLYDFVLAVVAPQE